MILELKTLKTLIPQEACVFNFFNVFNCFKNIKNINPRERLVFLMFLIGVPQSHVFGVLLQNLGASIWGFRFGLIS